jgi:hypothetical protein
MFRATYTPRSTMLSLPHVSREHLTVQTVVKATGGIGKITKRTGQDKIAFQVYPHLFHD